MVYSMHRRTMAEGVSGQVIGTRANGYVIDNATNCVDATNSWTGILAFVVDAGPVHGTVRVSDTFRSTTVIWISMVFWNAFANGVCAVRVAFGIGTAW